VASFDKDRDERAKLKADIEAGKDIPDHAFGRHNDLRELAENRRRQRAFAGEEEPAFHAMTKAEYQAYVESISPLPSDYFKIGDIPVVQNPTTDDYRAMSKQVREEFPNMPADTPKVRSTYDKRGNQWIWPAHKALHQHVEPDIERRVKTKVNQAFEIPKHSEYIRDALRQGLEIPQRVQAEYPQYAEFFSGKTKYDIGASKVMPTTETPGIETVPQQYFLRQVAMAYYGPERYTVIYPKSSPPPKSHVTHSTGPLTTGKKLETDIHGEHPTEWSVNREPGSAPGKPPRNLFGEYDPKTVKYPKTKEGDYAIQQSLLDVPERPAGAPEWTPPKPRQKSLLGTGQTGGAPGDEPAPNWVRMQGDRGATYWYNRVTNPNNLPDGRLYQTSPPTKAQERSAPPPRRAPEPAAKPDYKSPEPQPTLKVHDPKLEKRELTEIRGLINAGQKIPPALARKHAEAVKEIMAEKQADIQAKVDKERQWLKQALSEGRQISPALRNRHPDLVKIVESQRQQRVAASAEHRAQQVKPRAIHKPPEDRLKPPEPTRSNVFTAVPRSGHVAITEYPGKKFKYKIENPNPTNIPPHHDVLETRLVEENNELFRVSIVGTSHGKFYSQIEVADILDSQPGRQTIEFRPATPDETKVITSKSDKQSPVAATERAMWKRRSEWQSQAEPEPRPEDLPGQQSLFAQAHAFAEAVCEKYAPRWTTPAPGFRKKGRPSPGQKSFDFAAEEHASILRQWEFEDEVKHPRGGDGRWVKKHGAEQSDKPAPLFEHEKIDDAADLFRDEQGNLQQPDAAAVEKAVGKQWIDHATAEQIMLKLGVSTPSEQIKQLFYDQDMKRVNPTMPTRRFATTVASLAPKQVPVNPDYEPLKRLFYDEDGDAVLPHRGDVEKVLGPSINRKGATEAMRAIGLNDKPTMQRVLNGTFTRKGQTHETQESEWFAFRLFHELHQHIKQQRWQELASQVPGDATVIVFAKQSDPHERKLILHPSTYKRGMWQLSRRDKDGPVMHSDHKTKEDGLRAAIGVSKRHLDDEGDASYKLLWHNKSGTKAPFSLRTSKLRGAAVELYSQVAMNLYGPERYAKKLSLLEPAAGKPKDPTHSMKHPHLPGGTREGGRFAPKPKVPEVDPAEGMTAEERRNYYRELGKQARKRTKKWDPNRPVSEAQQEVNEVAEDIYNAANAGEYVSQPARDKFTKQIGGYVRRKVAKSGLQKSDQDDAAQDIFLKVWDKLTDPNAAGRWDPSKGNFTRWLGGVVARAISDQVAFAEMRQGREQRGKESMSALDVEGEGDENLSFVSQIADREYRALIKPQTMERLEQVLEKVYAKQLPGLTQPSERRAVELYFGIRAPNDKPMEHVSQIAKQLVREKLQRYNPHMTPTEVQEELNSEQSKAAIIKLRRYVISNKRGTGTLDPGGPLFRGLLAVAEQEKIGLEDFYEDPIRAMMEEQYTLASAEQYTLAYMLYKHRRHVHDFLRRPERYILAEMGTTPERYTRPFDESKVQRGAKGDPQGKGGQFVPKHGASPAGTQGVQAAQAPGSMTTPTAAAAPPVPKLLPSQPHQPQTGTTAKTAVALALLAAGVLGGKKTMGMGLLASAALPHLTKTMQTQAKQARSVLKQNPHSDFGKQLAESARKIDAKLKAAQAAEKKQQEMEQRKAEREAERQRQAAIRAQRAELAEQKLETERKLMPQKLEAMEAKAKSTENRAKAAEHKSNIAAMKAEIAEKLMPLEAETAKLKAEAKKLDADARQARTKANAVAKRLRSKADVKAAKIKLEDTKSKEKVRASERERREQTERVRKARAAVRTGFIPRETPDVKAALDRLVGSSPVKRDLVRMKLEELYRSKADDIANHNKAVDELMGLGVEIPFVIYEGTDRERKGTRPRTRRDIQDELAKAQEPNDIRGFDLVVNAIVNQQEDMELGRNVAHTYPILGLSGAVGESSVDSMRDKLFEALTGRHLSPDGKQQLTGYLPLPRRSDEALIRDAIDHAGVDAEGLFDPDQPYHEEARDEFTGDAPTDIDEQAERERQILDAKARKQAGEATFVEDIVKPKDEDVDYDPWAEDEPADERGDAWEPKEDGEQDDSDPRDTPESQNQEPVSSQSATATESQPSSGMFPPETPSQGPKKLEFKAPDGSDLPYPEKPWEISEQDWQKYPEELPREMETVDIAEEIRKDQAELAGLDMSSMKGKMDAVFIRKSIETLRETLKQGVRKYERPIGEPPPGYRKVTISGGGRGPREVFYKQDMRDILRDKQKKQKESDSDAIPFSMHQHARRELYTQFAAAYYGGKV